MADNTLYYGDNLDILRRYIKDKSVDLIYLDPPFKSEQDYNILFAEQNGTRSAAQIKAFEDTWHWDQASARAYEETVETAPEPVSRALQAFRKFLGENDMLAYLSMMAPRLLELRRVLKDTGGIYLHCDPTASHYLKMLMDAIFGPLNFRNEIVWKRTSAHSDAHRYGRVHDILLYYGRRENPYWHPTYQPYDESYVQQYYRYQDPDGRRWMSADLSAAGAGPPRDFSEHGELSPPPGRHWMYDQNGINKLIAQGRIYWTRNGVPRLKCYLDEARGLPVQDVWTDIEALRSWHRERLSYPTQKPEGILERIISASSKKGDIVLDPFCGCGTAVSVAHHLNRRWIGIDITHLAIALIKHRLYNTFGDQAKYDVIGEPADLAGAKALAKEDPYQFQFWALGLVGARPADPKKGADQGIDGRLYFHDDEKKTKQILFSVKSGKVGVSHIRDLRGVVEREKAEIGVYISLNESTKPMRKEVASAGFYTFGNHKYAKLQLFTIEELLKGKRIDYPGGHGGATFKKAPKAKNPNETENLPL